MRTKISLITSIAFLSALFTGCSPQLAGTWNVQRYETVTPGQQAVSLNNIGTLRFRNNGNGEKNLNYTVLGISQNDQTPFKWTTKDKNYVSIVSDGSDFSKTWIVTESKRKYQKWKSTDGSNNIQIIELKKQ